MNYLDGYVEEVLSEPYYDDYGSGIFRWWVEVSYICEGTESTTILMFDTRKDGVLLNADVNGSYNIMRKVKGDAVMPPYTGFGYNPVKKFIN